MRRNRREHNIKNIIIQYIAENVTVKEGSEPTTAAETTEAATTAK